MATASVSDSCFTCPKADCFNWHGNSLKGLAAFDRGKSTIAYDRKEVIFREGDPADGIHCIQSGQVAIGKTDRDGNMIFFRIADASATLGVQAFLAGSPHTTTAVTLTPSRICHIKAPAVEHLFERNPKLAREFFRNVATELDETENLYLIVARAIRELQAETAARTGDEQHRLPGMEHLGRQLRHSGTA